MITQLCKSSILTWVFRGRWCQRIYIFIHEPKDTSQLMNTNLIDCHVSFMIHELFFWHFMKLNSWLSVFLTHGCFFEVSKNRVSRGPPVPDLSFVFLCELHKPCSVSMWIAKVYKATRYGVINSIIEKSWCSRSK